MSQISQPEGTPLTSSPASENFPTSPTVQDHDSPMQSDHVCASDPRSPIKEMSLNTDYKGPVIPPSTKQRRKHRTLVLCFDGTGDQFDSDNSNVVQLVSLLKKGNSKQQLVYYQAGIGTYTIPQIATPWFAKLQRTIDMMLGTSLHHHVMGGYEFLMENFREGDRICIFGFSRGAYTARALAGMIEKVGLLPAGNHQQVPFAYKMYMQDDDDGWKQSCLFKKSFSMDVDIEFLGAWDTVDSVGLIPCHIPFTKNNTCVKTFRHAISLDEHRVKFKANHFDHIVTELGQNLDFSYTPLSEIVGRLFKKIGSLFGRWMGAGDEPARPYDAYNMGSRLQDKYTDTSKRTDVLEVWFAGCHTDVGGGSVMNDIRHNLARIPLRWMIRQCFLTNCGVQFAAEALHEVGLDPNSLYPIVKPRPPPLEVAEVLRLEKEIEEKEKRKLTKREMILEEQQNKIRCRSCPLERGCDEHDGSDDGTVVEERMISEEHEELHDALSPMFDQLEKNICWWILELIPLVHRVHKADGTSMEVISVNNGRPRIVSQQDKNGIKVHRSVKMRIEAEAEALGMKEKYVPRVKFDKEPTWVD